MQLINLFNNQLFNEILTSAIIIVLSFVLAKIIYYIFERIIKAWVKRTKTTLDDKIIFAVRNPFLLIVLSIGFYIALSNLTILSQYAEAIKILFKVIWIALGIHVVLKISDAIFEWYSQEVAPKTTLKLTEVLPTIKKIWLFIVCFIGLIIILGTLGIEITPLIASLGIGGLAVALAFQDTLINFFAGVYLTADRPIKVGDYIKLESGDEGHVVNIGWRNTQIRTRAGPTIIIPNKRLAESIVTNYHKPEKKMAVVIPVSVSYDSNLDKVEKVTIEVAKKVLKNTPGGVKDFNPLIRYTAFADSAINFNVILQCEEFKDQFLLKHEFIKALHKRYKKENIEIPYPKRDIYLKEIKR